MLTSAVLWHSLLCRLYFCLEETRMLRQDSRDDIERFGSWALLLTLVEATRG